jgi:hypothetical protein
MSAIPKIEEASVSTSVSHIELSKGQEFVELLIQSYHYRYIPTHVNLIIICMLYFCSLTKALSLLIMFIMSRTLITISFHHAQDL